MFKTTLVAAGIALAALPAMAGILTFDIDRTFIQGKDQKDIDETSFNMGAAGTFLVDPGVSGEYLDLTFPGSGTFSTIGTELKGYSFLRSFAAGETIGLKTFTSNTAIGDDWDTVLVANQTQGVWDKSHNGFLGFLSDEGNYGWLRYDYARVAGATSTLTLLDGAFAEKAGQSIIVPSQPAPVPIPFSAALLAGGLAGLGVMRRRKPKA